MDVTLINHTGWTKSIIYWIDPVLDTEDIETYLYASIENEKIEEIKNASTDKVQELLHKIF